MCECTLMCTCCKMYTKYKVCLGGALFFLVFCARVQECLHKCPCVSVSWNVQPLPLNRKGVQLIASPPFPLTQNGGQTRGTLTVSQSDRVLNCFQSEIPHNVLFPDISSKFAVYKAPGRRHESFPINLFTTICLLPTRYVNQATENKKEHTVAGRTSQ